jgi:putative sigma-54 modulation protein
LAVQLLNTSVMKAQPEEKLQMTISIRVRNIEWTGELREKVERSVAFALDRYDAQVSQVSVYLADLNGPKGGVDKLCQITATLRRGKPVMILEQGSEIMPTINRALGRLGHSIGRSIQRSKRPAADRSRTYEWAA